MSDTRLDNAYHQLSLHHSQDSFVDIYLSLLFPPPDLNILHQCLETMALYSTRDLLSNGLVSEVTLPGIPGVLFQYSCHFLLQTVGVVELSVALVYVGSSAGQVE